MITPPLCRACRRQHDPALVCVADDALRLYSPYRTMLQDEADGLEALRVARYAARRPVRAAVRPRRPSPPVAAAAVLAALALCMLLLTLVAAALH